MCDLRSLIYRLVISKSVEVASSSKQGWQYGTPKFLLRSTVRWYGTVQGSRYVVRKFGTYRTVLPSLLVRGVTLISIFIVKAIIRQFCKRLLHQTVFNRFLLASHENIFICLNMFGSKFVLNSLKRRS